MKDDGRMATYEIAKYQWQKLYVFLGGRSGAGKSDCEVDGIAK